jgi:hypothetical protein
LNADIPSKRVIIPPEELEGKISGLLDTFFSRRIASLQELELDKKLKAKNPYLFRALGVANAREIVQALLDAHISSSDETIFGNVFFEPLAEWVAEKSLENQSDITVQTGIAGGVDICVSTPDEFQAIAVKSGTKVFNQQSRDRQIEEFRSVERRLNKRKKHFKPIVGYCYGQKEQRHVKGFVEMAGQHFWEYLTGEEGFYLRIIRLMKLKPIEHRPAFIDEYNKATERFVEKFKTEHALQDGSINWDKLVTMVSERRVQKEKITKPKLANLHKKKPTSL